MELPPSYLVGGFLLGRSRAELFTTTSYYVYKTLYDTVYKNIMYDNVCSVVA